MLFSSPFSARAEGASNPPADRLREQFRTGCTLLKAMSYGGASKRECSCLACSDNIPKTTRVLR